MSNKINQNSTLFLLCISLMLGFLGGCIKKSNLDNTNYSTKKAPSFSLPDETGKLHTLANYLGKKIVLYFYPKDESPTCTAQACSMRDDFKVYQDKGIIVLAVSADSIESHRRFKEQHHLPFPLLSDKDNTVATMYGANGGLLGFIGRSERKTYLINEQGNLVKEITNVNVATQAEDILKGFDCLISK
jgi:peroxiredoxin Q/BCP